ncbi:hypothetical protein V6N11_067059 [Hibiscus sabdariffa]|uniref:Uncharacterized protein n=1 Tax=Hibiscus sabdariffa TaxID=183260 RepID=A0ABR2SQK5_9ROSI
MTLVCSLNQATKYESSTYSSSSMQSELWTPPTVWELTVLYFILFSDESLHCKSQTHPFSISFGIADNGSIVAVGRLVRHRCRLYAKRKMAIKFLDWYLKIAVGSALIGGSMELFMIKTGFYDKVTVLESEKRAWENSPEVQAMREALNPWRNHDAQERKSS